jgi:hypothetical protein
LYEAAVSFPEIGQQSQALLNVHKVASPQVTYAGHIAVCLYMHEDGILVSKSLPVASQYAFL